MDVGLELLVEDAQSAQPLEVLRKYCLDQRDHSDLFFQPRGETWDYGRDGDMIHFQSPIITETTVNNRAVGRVFETRRRERAILLLPHWNATAVGVDRLARLLRAAGIATLRLSLPYHDQRRPASMKLANHMVSANLGRTIRSCRQAILEARLAIAWLQEQGYKRIGVLGSSLGSSIASIVAAHDNRVQAVALVLTAGHFGEVVWTGRATRHIRQALERRITLADLNQIWSVISPSSYVDRLQGRNLPLLVLSGREDEVFPPYLTTRFIEELRARGVPHRWKLFRCGHYTMGTFPFSVLALHSIIRFFHKTL
jgi:pimeloyl-ACP methyl ester carboxylesterase